MQYRFSWSVPVSLVAIMAFISLAAAQEEVNLLESLLEPHDIETRSRKRLCGRMLTDALQLVCNSFYYSPQKRNIGHQLLFGRNIEQDPPYSNRELMAAMLSKRQFTQRGVADECCKKGCSFAELSSYCGERR